jgi:hypothetical protein
MAPGMSYNQRAVQHFRHTNSTVCLVNHRSLVTSPDELIELVQYMMALYIYPQLQTRICEFTLVEPKVEAFCYVKEILRNQTPDAPRLFPPAMTGTVVLIRTNSIRQFTKVMSP